MPTLRLDLAYDGGGFAGWAGQPGMRTVEGELRAALERILGSRPELAVAGRTDAGVHAWGQVASFVSDRDPPPTLARALDGITEEDLVVLGAAQVEDGFDARRDARSRTYCYRLLASRTNDPFERGRALRWPHRIEVEALRHCAQAMVGEHDFTAFTPTQTKHVRFRRRVARAEWRRSQGNRLGGELLEFWIEADAFLRAMIRVLVGTMLEVAGGRRSLENFERLLGGAPRTEAADTAAAHGLYLASVRY
jgi:tRNA pseudouridine38-40 synthase